MRVVFFSDFPHRLAGSQKSLALSLSEISEHGITPTVLLPQEGIFGEHCRARGLDVHVLPAPPAFQTFGRALTRMSPAAQLGVLATETIPYSVALLRFAQGLGAGAIHFNTPRGLVMAGWAAAASSLPVVTHLRGVPALGARYWLTAQAMSDRFVLVARTLERYFVDSVRARCRAVYNGVEIPDELDHAAARGEIFDELSRRGHAVDRIRASVAAGAMVCVTLSSPTPFKGLHHLLDAAAEVKRRGGRVVYLAAGSSVGDEYESWLHSKKRELGLDDDFHFVGFTRDPTQLLAAGDVTLLPSVQDELLTYAGRTEQVQGTEGLPRTVLESFAVGVPVIVSDVAGVREQLEDGMAGFIVAPGDAGALARQIEIVAADPGWRKRAGAIGLDTVRARFSVTSAAAGLARVLREPKPALRQRAHGWMSVAAQAARSLRQP